MGFADGVLSAVVWPTYAGAFRADGVEPMNDVDYERGPITWEVSPHGLLLGRCRILVPAGQWCHILYTHHPLLPKVFGVQKLVHPFTLYEPGHIDLEGITQDDIQPLSPDPILRD